MFVSVLFGATVRLFYNGSIVENTWLDSGVGTNTEITGSDGQYNFVLNGNASSGTYTLEVEPPSGYIFESTDIPAETTSYEPNLGAGEESIQTQETAPTTSETTTYYLSFSFTIENVAAETSNGVIHNHIPVDPIAASGKELVNKVKAPLTKVLKQDFHDTVSGQMNDFSNIARQSVRRLEKNNINELILATSTTIEGEATAHYVQQIASTYNIKVSRIAFGIPLNGEIGYLDSETISHAFNERKVL